MNFNKYALVMFAFVGVVSIMMGISSSSYAQENQTSTSPSMGSSNQTSIASSNPTTPTADNNNSSSMSSANSASPQATTKNASGPMDMIKNLFKSFMGGNK
jgi:cytoskeletal protein RodZ